MRSHFQAVGMLLAVDASDITDRGDRHAHTERIEVHLAIGFQLVESVDQRQAHALGTEDVHLNDVALGREGGVDTVVKFDDKFGAARQRFKVTFHD